MKHEDCCTLNDESRAIVDALYDAENPDDVFEALSHVPSRNLLIISRMISDILITRVDDAEVTEEEE